MDIAIDLIADGEIIAQGLGQLEADWPDEASTVMVRAADGAGRMSQQILALEVIESLVVSEPVPLDVAAIEQAQGCSCDATGIGSLLWLLPLVAVRRRRVA